MHNYFKIKPRVAYIIETAGIMRRKQQEATLLWGLCYRLEKIRVQKNPIEGVRDIAIFKAVVTEYLVSHNTPVTKIIHLTLRQAKHRVLKWRTIFQGYPSQNLSNSTSLILQWQNEPLVFPAFKTSVFAILNALSEGGFFTAVNENMF